MTKWIQDTCINPLVPMGRGPMQDHQSDTTPFYPRRHHQGLQIIEKPKAQPSPSPTARNRKARLGMPLQWQPTLLEKGQEHFRREQVMNQIHKFCTGQVPTHRHCTLSGDAFGHAQWSPCMSSLEFEGKWHPLLEGTIIGSHEPERRSYDCMFFYHFYHTDMLSASACLLSTLDIGSR